MSDIVPYQLHNWSDFGENIMACFRSLREVGDGTKWQEVEEKENNH